MLRHGRRFGASSPVGRYWLANCAAVGAQLAGFLCLLGWYRGRAAWPAGPSPPTGWEARGTGRCG